MVGPEKFFSTIITLVGPTVVPILQFFHLAILGPMNTKSISITFVGPINTKSDMITILGPMHTKSIIITQVYHTDRSELQLSRVLTKSTPPPPGYPWVPGCREGTP